MTRDTPTSTSNATADPQQLRIAQLEQEVISERLLGLSQLINNEQVHEDQIKKIANAPQKLAQPPRKKVKRGKKAPLQLVEYDDGAFRDRKGHMVNIRRGFHFVLRKHRFPIDPAKMPFHIHSGPVEPVFDTSAADKELKVIVGTVSDCAHPGFKVIAVCLLSELETALRTKLLAKHGAKLEIIQDIYNSKYSTWIGVRKIWEWQCLREGIKHYDQLQWPYGVLKTEVTTLTYNTAITPENKPLPCHSIAPVIMPREIKSTALTNGPDGDMEMVAGAGLTDTLGNPRSLVIGGGRGRGRGNARSFPNGALARTSRNVLRLQQQAQVLQDVNVNNGRNDNAENDGEEEGKDEDEWTPN
ncbi:hypothetical protein BJX62DRAFT_234718 [Aspergillus germanicus]